MEAFGACAGMSDRPFRCLLEPEDHFKIYCVARSNDGRITLAGGGRYEETQRDTIRWTDCAVRLLESGDNKTHFLVGHSAPVLCAATSLDGRFAVTGGGDGLRIWDLGTRRNIAHVPTFDSNETFVPSHTDLISGVAFSANGQSVISGSYDKTLILRRNVGAMADGRWDDLRPPRQFIGHGGRVRSVAFVPNRHLVVSGSDDRTVRLWDEETAKEVHRFEGHTGPVTSVAASPDGRLVLSGSEDGTTRLWAVQTGKELCRYRVPLFRILGVAFTPDGHQAISCGTDGTVRLWKVPD